MVQLNTTRNDEQDANQLSGKMKKPWLIIGVGIGIFTMCPLIPLCSDLTGKVETAVVLGCLFGVVVLGVLLDAFFSSPPAAD
jgi:hypothetical protein